MNALKNPRLREGCKRIFVVDDHAILRDGLRELLNHSDDLSVCGEAASGEEALQKIGALKADLAVVDLSLPGMGGLDLLKHLQSRFPSLPVLILSMSDETIYAERCIRAGARGYIMKHQAIDDFRAAALQVLSGKIFLSARMSERMLESMAQRGSKRGEAVDSLSDRELEVYDLIGHGRGASDIARRLHLSVKTIETYRAKLKEKLHLKDADELFQHALRWAGRKS